MREAQRHNVVEKMAITGVLLVFMSLDRGWGRRHRFQLVIHAFRLIEDDMFQVPFKMISLAGNGVCLGSNVDAHFLR